jgi:hypothetical protein
MSDPSPREGTETLPELVSRVVDDAKEVARAEVDLVKAQAAAKLAGYRAAAILFALAGLLVVAAVIGLVLGLVLTLAQYWGAGPATTAVTGGFLLLAGLLGWLGMRRWRQG